MLSRLTSVPVRTFVGAAKQVATPQTSQRLTCIMCQSRNYANQTGKTLRGKLRTPTVKEQAMAPAGETAFTMGKGLVAGASLLGVGALCFYGVGMSNDVGAIDRAAIWPDTVRTRIRDTYMYFGGSLVATAGTAVAVLRSPTVMNLMMKNNLVSVVLTLGAMIGTGMVARSIPYKEGFGAKQLAWLAHTGVMGAVIAPMTLMGGPLVLRAALYTAGVVGGLSMLAVCAPSDKFLNMGGPLAMGLGVVFASSLGSMFLPPTTALGAGLYSVALYGGLVLFGMFLLYDTQKIIKRAETHPTYAAVPYDPINNSISIYLDTMNIFIRILTILAGGGGGRKR